MNSVFLNHIRDVCNPSPYEPNGAKRRLAEALETWDNYHDKTDTQIVKDFFDRKIYGVKALRLVRDLSLTEAKQRYERIHDEIENEVDVNLLGQFLKVYCQSNHPNTWFKVDMFMFNEFFNDETTLPVARKLATDGELMGLGIDPFLTKLYRAARDHYNNRLEKKTPTLGDILGDALNK